MIKLYMKPASTSLPRKIYLLLFSLALSFSLSLTISGSLFAQFDFRWLGFHVSLVIGKLSPHKNDDPISITRCHRRFKVDHLHPASVEMFAQHTKMQISKSEYILSSGSHLFPFSLLFLAFFCCSVLSCAHFIFDAHAHLHEIRARKRTHGTRAPLNK